MCVISYFRHEEGEKLAFLGYLGNNPEEPCTQQAAEYIQLLTIFQMCRIGGSAYVQPIFHFFCTL
jgi:hypothetical protein